MRRLPTLTKDRLTLRAARAEDVDDVYVNISDWEVVRMLALPPWPYTREDAQAFVARLMARRDDDAASTLMIVRDGAAVGAIGTSRRDGAPFVGYWLGRRHWGQGLMTEALRAVARQLFADGSTDISSGFFLDNTGSWRVQEKLGFARIGQGLLYCAPRRSEVPEIRTRLTRAAFERHVS